MSKYNPNIHHRRSIRLKGYDYSQEGLYFVTICVQNRKYLFGHIVNKKMILNDAGQMVQSEWVKLPQRFQNIQLHEYIVMPNHFHAILEIVGATLVVASDMGQPQGIAPTISPSTDAPTDAPTIPRTDASGITPTISPPTDVPTDAPTVGDMIGAFKSITTVEYIRGVKSKNWQPFDRRLWQRNYWEHIIRNEKSYKNISQYIINNPIKWDDDKFYK